MALEHGYSTSPDLGGFDHSNIVEDHVQRLEQLATVGTPQSGCSDPDHSACTAQTSVRPTLQCNSACHPLCVSCTHQTTPYACHRR